MFFFSQLFRRPTRRTVVISDSARDDVPIFWPNRRPVYDESLPEPLPTRSVTSTRTEARNRARRASSSRRDARGTTRRADPVSDPTARRVRRREARGSSSFSVTSPVVYARCRDDGRRSFRSVREARAAGTQASAAEARAAMRSAATASFASAAPPSRAPGRDSRREASPAPRPRGGRPVAAARARRYRCGVLRESDVRADSGTGAEGGLHDRRTARGARETRLHLERGGAAARKRGGGGGGGGAAS